jgi:dolichol-phosphate mannosyltransferase
MLLEKGQKLELAVDSTDLVEASSRPRYSVILPIYNEESCLREIVGRVGSAMDAMNTSYEIICVDDCSTDSTWSIIESLHSTRPSVKGVRFFRNFGHQIAVFAGISHTTGDYIAVLDADGQDPPELLPRMFQKCREGYDVVYAVRRNRKEHIGKRFAYALFYRFFRRLVPFDVPLDSGDFSVFTRSVASFISSRTEKKPFIRGLRSWHGGKQVAFEYDRQKRAAGEPKYTLLKLVMLALNASVSFSKIPLRVISLVGLIISPIAFLLGVILIILKLSVGINLSGWTSIATLIIFFGGIHLFVLGIIGEYIGDIFDEVKNRPVFLVEQKIGLD